MDNKVIIQTEHYYAKLLCSLESVYRYEGVHKHELEVDGHVMEDYTCISGAEWCKK